MHKYTKIGRILKETVQSLPCCSFSLKAPRWSICWPHTLSPHFRLLLQTKRSNWCIKSPEDPMKNIMDISVAWNLLKKKNLSIESPDTSVAKIFPPAAATPVTLRASTAPDLEFKEKDLKRFKLQSFTNDEKPRSRHVGKCPAAKNSKSSWIMLTRHVMRWFFVTYW